MAISVDHTFVSAIADDAAAQAAGEVLPSHWNAAHTLAGFGTNVATALAVNVGSAGALVVNGGALGTPSSGTLTSATGLPAAGVVGTAAILGANTFTGEQTVSGAALILSGAISAAAWTTGGLALKESARTLTDTSSTGTVAAAYSHVLGTNTVAASSATTFTDYASVYIGDPVAGTNVTLTNKSSLITQGNIQALAFNGIGTATSGLFFPSAGRPGIRAGNVAAINFQGDQINIPSTYYIGWTTGALHSSSGSDLRLARGSAATLQQGGANAAVPVAQTIQAQGSRSGTDSNIGGADYTHRSGTGTGTGTLSSLILQSPIAVASGTGAQTQTTGLAIKAGAAVLTSYIVSGLPAAATAGAGAIAFVTDALTPVALAAVVGGGAVKVPVYSDGSAWNVI